MKFKIFFLFLVLGIVLIFKTSAWAQEFSVGINPPVIQIDAKAPARIKSPVTLQNSSDQNITYGIFLRPFKANADKNGNPNYDSTLSNEYKDLFSHVEIKDSGKTVTEVALAPGESKDLSLNVSLPDGFKPGDYYFTIVFLSQTNSKSQGNSFGEIQGGIGTNVLLTVGGEKKPSEGRIALFSSPSFVSHGPISFTLELANHNNYYVSSNGNIIIKNIFNQPVGNIEFGPVNILANSNRLIGNNGDENNPKLVWNQKFLIGIYKAQANVALSDRGPLLTQTKTFLAFPIQGFLVIIIVILVISWLIKSARKKSLKDD